MLQRCVYSWQRLECWRWGPPRARSDMELRADRLSVRQGERPVLRDVDCILPPGSRVLVLGRSGAGKTTLFKALAGLLAPASGRVLWNGEDVARMAPAGKRARQAAFGMVFQTDALFDSL